MTMDMERHRRAMKTTVSLVFWSFNDGFKHIIVTSRVWTYDTIDNAGVTEQNSSCISRQLRKHYYLRVLTNVILVYL